MRRRLTVIVLLTGVMLGAILLIAHGAARRAKPRAESARAASPMTPAEASSRGEIDAGFLGVILPHQVIELAPRSPTRVDRVLVGLGDNVKRGQLLAVLDCRSLSSDLASARASMQEAQAQQRKDSLEVDYARYRREQRELGAREIAHGLAAVSPSELRLAAHQADLAERDLDVGSATLSGRRARVSDLERQEKECSLRAPFDGRVTASYVEPGGLASASLPVLRVIDDERRRVRFAIDEAAAAGVTVGTRLRVRAGAIERDGEVEKISPELDTASGTVLAEGRLAQLDSDEALRVGSVVRVTLGAP
jgi:RND family efflux transporter MFP subunit